MKPVRFHPVPDSRGVHAPFAPFGDATPFVGKALFRDSKADVTFGLGIASKGNVDVSLRADMHVFVAVLQGEISISAAGMPDVTIHTDEALHIAKGSSVRWRHTGPGTFVIGMFNGDGAEAHSDSVLKIDPTHPLSPSAPSPAALLLSATPDQKGNVFFADATGQWKAGVWQSTNYRRKVIPFPRHEFMLLLEGEAILTEPEGESFAFGPGEAFLIPAGWTADWNAPRFMKKIYCTFTAA